MRVAVETYHLTATFPGHELYGMVSQMRRASVSIGSNISEGCGRQGDRAMIAYLHQAMGSLDELEFQLELAIELGYSRASDASVLGNALLVTKGMMTRLLASLRQRVRDHESRGMGP
jgi:four helix bundle protein